MRNVCDSPRASERQWQHCTQLQSSADIPFPFHVCSDDASWGTLVSSTYSCRREGSPGQLRGSLAAGRMGFGGQWELEFNFNLGLQDQMKWETAVLEPAAAPVGRGGLACRRYFDSVGVHARQVLECQLIKHRAGADPKFRTTCRKSRQEAGAVLLSRLDEERAQLLRCSCARPGRGGRWGRCRTRREDGGWWMVDGRRGGARWMEGRPQKRPRAHTSHRRECRRRHLGLKRGQRRRSRCAVDESRGAAGMGWVLRRDLAS